MIEVLVATAIVGIVFVSLIGGFTWGFTLVRLARENVRAAQILQEKTETLRLYNWDQINTPGFIPTNFTAAFDPTSPSTGVIYTGTVVVTDAPVTESYSNTLRQVIVEVGWTAGKINRNRRMSTFVSRYGLQNYIY